MTAAGQGRAAPASWRRAFFVLAGAVLAGVAGGAPAGAPAPREFLQLSPPDQAEGRAAIEQFRRSGPARPYYLEFVLRKFPRRGPERIVPGRLWGARNARGNVLRIEIDPGRKGVGRRYLAQNGSEPAVWAYDAASPGTAPRLAPPTEPLEPGVDITPFDLQMPYLYWPGAELLGVERIRGRPAHLFAFRPAVGAGAPPGVGAVRAYLDTEYHAPVEAEVFAADGSPVTTLSLVGLKKVDEQWIPEDIDVRSESTRDKTRFSVTAAALDLELPPELFLADHLPEEAAPPAPERLTSFNR